MPGRPWLRANATQSRKLGLDCRRHVLVFEELLGVVAALTELGIAEVEPAPCSTIFLAQVD